MKDNPFGTYFSELQESVKKARTEPIKNRIRRIKSIEKWTLAHRDEINEAVFKDLGKPTSPSDISEIYTVTSEARTAYRNLKQWNRPRKVDAPITQLGTRSVITYEPMGVSLIISPWNFPYNLSVIPLISCLAAGNVAILKPSEMSPHTSALIKRMCEELFDSSIVKVVEGDKEVATSLLQLPFDHIFFTGSPAIGKIIMEAGAKHLSKVTLELGGKNPVLIAPDADLKDAARKVVWGKFLNCGQSCVAADYILVPESSKDKFVSYLRDGISKNYAGEMARSTLGKIINEHHWDRLNALLEASKKEELEIETFGELRREDRSMPPVIIEGVQADSTLMNDEIFGPFVPILTYSTLDEALAIIDSKPKPLGLYLFTRSRPIKKQIAKQTSSGALVINDLVIQFGNKNLPFGGVNNSGAGKSHGFYGFREFSNEKPITRQLRGLTIIFLFYPPYNRFKRFVLDMVVKYLG